MAPDSSEPRGALVAQPDLGVAARLMNETWAEPRWAYSEIVLADYLRRPSGDPNLTVGWQRGGRLMGFFAGVPIEVDALAGHHRAIFTSFMTAHPDAKHPGMAMQLFSEVVATARASGAVNVYTVFHHDAATNRFVRRLFQMCVAPVQDLLEFTFLMRPLLAQAASPSDAEVVPYEARWLAAVTDAIATASSRVPLAQVVAASDLASILANPQTMTRLLLRGGEPKGVIVGRRRDVISKRPARHVHLDFVALAALTPTEQDRLLTGFSKDAADERNDALIVPDLGYFDVAVLKRNGFLRFASHAVLAVAPLVPQAPKLDRVAGCFFEVY